MSTGKFVICRGVVWLFMGLAVLAAADTAARGETIQRYVSPDGTGMGHSPDNPASYNNNAFWNLVDSTLQNTGPVNVTFMDGEYTDQFRLNEFGSPDHQLTLQSQSHGGALFNHGGRIQLHGSTNIAVRDFGFTGDHPAHNPDDPNSSGGRIYKLLARDYNGTPSSYIRFENNQFYDSPTYYGAMGVAHGSHHVTIADNHVNNVGHDNHAHMVYTAHDVHHIKVINNHFQDVPGDYVRFRDHGDFGEVRDNTFISSSAEFNREFVAMPVFNLDHRDEIHASNYLIRDNEFIYHETDGNPHHRNVIGWLSSGYNPPSVNRHLITPSEAAILTSGTVEEKRDRMMELMHIDLSKTRVYDNEYTNENFRVRYHAYDAGHEPGNWYTTPVNISDAINSDYIGAGDVYSDGVLDEKDVELFLLAYAHDNEQDFLYDDRVWFGDWQAADMTGDGQVGFDDLQPFIDVMEGHVSEEVLAPVYALIPEPTAASMLLAGLGALALRRRKAT